MAMPLEGDILIRVPGRLSANPSAIGAYPHGGTALGIVKAKALHPNAAYEEIHAEEYGERIEVLDVGWAWTFACVLRSWDKDMVAAVFPTTSVGASGKAVVKHPNMVDANAGRAGRILSASSLVLVFTPDSPAQHPGFILHRALPLLDVAAQMQDSLSDPHEIALAFLAIRSATGKSVSQGILSDLSL